MFKIGDKVRVTNPHPENEVFYDMTGTIEKIENDDIGVSGLYGKFDRLKRAVFGWPAFESHELTKI